MKNNDRTIKTVLSTVLTLMPALIGTVACEFVPAEAGHMIYGIWGVPAALALVNLLCIWFTHRDRGNDDQSGKVMNLIYMIVPILSICMVGAMIQFLMDYENTDTFIAFVISVMFIVIGNETPKFRRNSTLGVKLPWTLRNDDNWRATHRLTGKLWVIGGFVMAFGMLLPREGLNMGIFIAALIVMIAVPIIYSWNFSRRQIKDGTWRDDGQKPVSIGRRGAVFSVVMLAAVGVIVIVSLFCGNIEFRLEEERLVAAANFYSDLEVPYDTIDSAELVEGSAKGTRTFGYGGISMSCGSFRNAELGNYTRYTVEGAASHILLKAGDGYIVLSTKTDEGNAELYREIDSRLDRDSRH